MKQNREPRNKSTIKWSINLLHWRQKCTMGKRKSLQQMVLGKLDSNFSDIDCMNIFLDISPEARGTKAKINCWDYIKIKNLLHSKGNKQQN